MYCISNTDCESLTGTTVCKETVHGGARTCQASTVCSQVCSYKEFCDAANTCQYGRLQMDAYSIHLKIQFQYTAYQVPIVNLTRYAKKVKLVAHLLARQQQVAVKCVPQDSFVMQQIHAKTVSWLLFDFYRILCCVHTVSCLRCHIWLFYSFWSDILQGIIQYWCSYLSSNVSMSCYNLLHWRRILHLWGYLLGSW